MKSACESECVFERESACACVNVYERERGVIFLPSVPFFPEIEREGEIDVSLNHDLISSFMEKLNFLPKVTFVMFDTMAFTCCNVNVITSCLL